MHCFIPVCFVNKYLQYKLGVTLRLVVSCFSFRAVVPKFVSVHHNSHCSSFGGFIGVPDLHLKASWNGLKFFNVPITLK